MNHIFKIEGGELPLQNIVPWHLKTIKSLIKTRVLFLSQISASGNFLFDFHDIILKTYNNTQRGGFIPAWYKTLKTTVLSNPVNSMRLKPDFCTDVSYLEGYDCTELIDFPKDIGWAAMWTPKENNVYNLPIPGEPIFGKFYKIKTLAPPCLFQHFNITNSTFDPRSPSKRTSVLVPCSGCTFNQNKQYYNIKLKFKSLPCAAFVDPLLPCPITTSLLANNDDRFHVPKRSIWPLMDQAIARFKNLNNTEVPYVFNDALNIDFDNISINRLFIDPDCINTLFRFKNRLLFENNLEFYTDGSHLFVDTSLTSYISSAFLLVHDNIDICYAAALTPIWANSTNAEIFALLLTLLICPFNSRITINTDSLNLILTYNRLVNTNASRYPSILLKTPFYLFWCFILRIIEQNQIALFLVKVKSHSGNPFNEKVDQLAKSALTKPPLTLSLNHIPYIPFVPTFRNIPINKEIRPFFKDYINSTTFTEFLGLKRNSKYSALSVNWLCTFQLINYEPLNQTTFKESYQHKRKYQLLLELLPSIESLKISRPDLYDDNWTCCKCLTEKETFDHIWLCSSNHRILNQITHSAFILLKNQLFIQTSKTVWSNELNELMNPTFDYWTPNVNTFMKFNIVDMIKGIIPSHLFLCINNFTNCNKKTTIILSNLFEHIQTQAITLIWIPRCDLTIAAELQLGITKKKKLYTKAPKNSNHSVPSSSLLNSFNISPLLILLTYFTILTFMVDLGLFLKQ